mmetsp:Transcript_20568/g.28594  ORF Transcript_20568/g.28594 Transcript_20568/m.28594 type:complete len:100 (+) Transcript_20568:978-1277(+)
MEDHYLDSSEKKEEDVGVAAAVHLWSEAFFVKQQPMMLERKSLAWSGGKHSCHQKDAFAGSQPIGSFENVEVAMAVAYAHPPPPPLGPTYPAAQPAVEK